MSQAETTVKHVGDVAATVSGLGSFSAATLANLQGISLILAIIASLFSIGWMAFRAYYFWKHGIKP